MSLPELIRIVSRDSPMALAQVERVRSELVSLHPGVRTEVVPVRTTGDKWMGDLSKVEGKGAFTKEVDAALLAGEADLAVHCVKDVPADRPLPAGTTFAAFLKRDDVRDALIHPGGLTLDELPEGTRIGTSSVRRVAQLAATHPHLECVPFRGNANRRLAKLAAGEADALLLAVAGLERIGREDVISEVLSPETMMPPIGAGILALQCREGDTELIEAVSALGDPDTFREATAERMFLHVLQGHCNSPIAGYARVDHAGELSLRACVFTPDGKTRLNAHEWAGRLDPATLGTSVAVALLRQGAREIIDGIPQEVADLAGQALAAHAHMRGALVESDAACPQPAVGPLVVDPQLDLHVDLIQARLGSRREQYGGGAAQRVHVEALDELRVAPVDEGALAVGADPHVDLAVLEMDGRMQVPAVLDGHPHAEIGEPFGGVVASTRRLGRLQTVDADTQTGMLVVLLPVPDHVRLVHSAPHRPQRAASYLCAQCTVK
jgi:hydroxymethylbilane synthase